MKEKLGIWLIRPHADLLGKFLEENLGGKVFRPWLKDDITQRELFRTVFRQYEAWLLVMPTGIAVRFLDGLISDKKTDPCVVVLDEGCISAVSLLGGHEAGGNNLAYRVANLVGANPVVTTGTEVNKPLTLGIGCRKNVALEKIEECVRLALGERSLSEVRQIATVDLKADEPALLQFSEKYNIPLRIFATADLEERCWSKNPSQWVKDSLGVVGVCEPCALMASIKGSLITPKTTHEGVAVAVVEDLPKYAEQQKEKNKDKKGLANVR